MNFRMVQTISSQRSEQIRDGEEAKDLILDIQFDAFGKRFATASSDQKIRVSSLRSFYFESSQGSVFTT